MYANVAIQRKSWRNTDVIITWKLRRFDVIMVSTLHYMCPLRKVIDPLLWSWLLHIASMQVPGRVCVNSKNTAHDFPLCVFGGGMEIWHDQYRDWNIPGEIG